MGENNKQEIIVIKEAKIKDFDTALYEHGKTSKGSANLTVLMYTV